VSQVVTLQLPEKVFESVQRAATAAGKTPAEWIVGQMLHHLPDADFLAKQLMTEEQKREAHERLRSMFGFFHSGDPHGSDNDKIDADLAREYGNLDQQDP
jgi:hypothetical protein